VPHESPSQPDDVVLSLVGRPAVTEEHQGRRVGRSLRHPHQTGDPSGGPHYVESALGDALRRHSVSHPVEAHLSEPSPRTKARAATTAPPQRRRGVSQNDVPERWLESVPNSGSVRSPTRHLAAHRRNSRRAVSTSRYRRAFCSGRRFSDAPRNGTYAWVEITRSGARGLRGLRCRKGRRSHLNRRTHWWSRSRP
jgi:hypothetical protein